MKDLLGDEAGALSILPGPQVNSGAGSIPDTVGTVVSHLGCRGCFRESLTLRRTHPALFRSCPHAKASRGSTWRAQGRGITEVDLREGEHIRGHIFRAMLPQVVAVTDGSDLSWTGLQFEETGCDADGCGMRGGFQVH